MEGKMEAFSFDSILLNKVKTPSLVGIKSSDSLPKVIKLVDEHKIKTLNETKIFYRNLLESDNDYMSIKDAYNRFFGTIVKLNTFYKDKYTQILKSNLTSFVDKDQHTIITNATNAIREYRNNDIILDEHEQTQYKLSNDIPKSEGVLTTLLDFCGGNFYDTTEEDAEKLLKSITDNYRKILRLAKRSIIKDRYVNEFDFDVSKLFKGDIVVSNLRKSDINDIIATVNNTGLLLKENYDNAIKINTEYKKLVNKIIQFRNSTKIKVNIDDKVNKIERILLSLISQVWSYHLVVFSAKGDAIICQYRDNLILLSKIADTHSAVSVEEIEESCTIYKRLIKEQNLRFSKLTDKEILMNSIVNMKHNELIMDCCIKEAMILAEGINVEARLTALHEGVWAKVKEYFEKVKAFVSGLFDKVMNWFDKFFKSNQAYLEKYKEYLSKPTAGFDTVNMPNYEEGLKRIKENTLPDFSAAIDVKNKEIKDEDVEIIVHEFQVKLLNGTAFDSKTIDFKEACIDYFKGGKDSEKDYAAANINIQTLATEVLNIPKLVDGIKKDKSTADQLYKSLESTINQMAAAKPEPAEGNKPESAGNDQQGAKKESALYLYSNVFNEDITLNQSSSSTSTPTGVTNNGNGAAIANAGNTAVVGAKNMSADDAAKSQKLVNKMASTISTYYQCKYQSAEKIMSDYMKIIKAHVSAYVKSNNASN